MVKKEYNCKLCLRQQKAVIRLLNFFKTPVSDTESYGIFHGCRQSGPLFHSSVRKKSWFWKKAYFQQNLVDKCLWLWIAHKWSSCTWCCSQFWLPTVFLIAVQPQGSVKSLNTWTVTVKKQQEQTCHSVKYISRWRYFWGAEQLLKWSVPLES